MKKGYKSKVEVRSRIRVGQQRELSEGGCPRYWTAKDTTHPKRQRAMVREAKIYMGGKVYCEKKASYRR
jgi:hypothetical protein